MIKSMTGAGRAAAANEAFDITVRMQSVNSRYLDVNIRMSSAFSEHEALVRSICREQLSRGKVEVSLDIKDLRENAVVAVVNDPVVRAYLDAVYSLVNLPEVESTVNPASVLAFPQALRLETQEIEDIDGFKAQLEEAVRSAVDDIVASRLDEGRRMAEDITSRLKHCRSLLKSITHLAGTVKEEYLKKLSDRISEMLEITDLDEGRLEQEVAFIVDKSDVSEEITRLASHFDALEELLDKDEPIGKKLDFTVQEMNRETNTIGSKSKNIEINRHVIDMKSEIEKIREQVQNIE